MADSNELDPYKPASKKRTLSRRGQDSRPVEAVFLEKVETIQFEIRDQTDSLSAWLQEKNEIEKYKLNARILHHLAANDSKIWEETTGKLLLKWAWEEMGGKTLFITKVPPRYHSLEIPPLHRAIENKKSDLVDCFLQLCADEYGIKLKRKNLRDMQDVLEAPKDGTKNNCLHCAIRNQLPCAIKMASVCSETTLKTKNEDGDTPLHLAMKLGKGSPIPRWQPPKSSVESNTSRSRTWNSHDELNDIFAPSRLLEQIRKRCKNNKQLMSELLTITNSAGQSPYQTRLVEYGTDKDHEEIGFQAELKQLIFDTLDVIPDVSKALYGTQGYEKELCLDMSDFNQTTHDFKKFVQKLIKINSVEFKFEETLFFVHLPDLNNIRKPCPHEGVRSLFDWLQKNGVRRIKTLSMRDNTTTPMSDALVEEGIIQKFEIEKLDWRKLDVNLETFTSSKHAKYFTDLTLYSSGNWSVLYHWMSEAGLATLENLREVKINIVHPNPLEREYDEASYKRHGERAQKYRTKLEQIHKDKLEKEKVGYSLVVKDEVLWDYPVVQYPENEEPFVPKLNFLHQLKPTHDYFRTLEKGENGEYRTRYRELTEKPDEGSRDKRIKIAIIDNGIDRVRANVKDMIAKGVSYVTADMENQRQILPWWMVADPHGTQMASLIGQTNPHCRLYIARVGKGRKDILLENAAKAIHWALEQQVDIISMSWVTKKDHAGLKKAVQDAVKQTDSTRPTLIFCSTADEGVYSGGIWPANYENTVKVAATDQYGHMRPTSTSAVEILVPGEDIVADGPSYMDRYVEGTVSGSSVATALAAGIASLALLMIKTFNDINEADEDWKYFHTKEGIMKVFQKMEGLQAGTTGVTLSTLFPDKDSIGNLATEWEVGNLRQRT